MDSPHTLSHTPVSEYTPQKIFLSGGAGFIGSCVAHALAKQGLSLVVVDKLDYCARRENIADILDMDIVSFAKVDITDVEAVKKVFRNITESSLTLLLLLLLNSCSLLGIYTSTEMTIADFANKSFLRLNIIRYTKTILT